MQQSLHLVVFTTRCNDFVTICIYDIVWALNNINVKRELLKFKDALNFKCTVIYSLDIFRNFNSLSRKQYITGPSLKAHDQWLFLPSIRKHGKSRLPEESGSTSASLLIYEYLSEKSFVIRVCISKRHRETCVCVLNSDEI